MKGVPVVVERKVPLKNNLLEVNDFGHVVKKCVSREVEYGGWTRAEHLSFLDAICGASGIPSVEIRTPVYEVNSCRIEIVQEKGHDRWSVSVESESCATRGEQAAMWKFYDGKVAPLLKYATDWYRHETNRPRRPPVEAALASTNASVFARKLDGVFGVLTVSSPTTAVVMSEELKTWTVPVHAPEYVGVSLCVETFDARRVVVLDLAGDSDGTTPAISGTRRYTVGLPALCKRMGLVCQRYARFGLPPPLPGYPHELGGSVIYDGARWHKRKRVDTHELLAVSEDRLVAKEKEVGPFLSCLSLTPGKVYECLLPFQTGITMLDCLLSMTSSCIVLRRRDDRFFPDSVHRHIHHGTSTASSALLTRDMHTE